MGCPMSRWFCETWASVPETRATRPSLIFLTFLPSPSLEHLRLVHPCDGEAFHCAGEVFADFE